MVITRLVEKTKSPVSKKHKNKLKDDTMAITKLVAKIKSPVSDKHKNKVCSPAKAKGKYNSLDIMNVLLVSHIFIF